MELYPSTSEELVFSPFLSGENGHVVEAEGVCDFTIYPEGDDWETITSPWSLDKDNPPVKIFMTAVDFPSTLYKAHIPLLINTIPTNKRQTPSISSLLRIILFMSIERKT